jgi:hypothetical protein
MQEIADLRFQRGNLGSMRKIAEVAVRINTDGDGVGRVKGLKWLDELNGQEKPQAGSRWSNWEVVQG